MFKRTRILVCAVIVLAPASLALQGAWAQTATTMDPNMPGMSGGTMAPTTAASGGGGGGGAATGGGGAATTGGGGAGGGGAATTGGGGAGGGGAATTGGGATGRSQATGGATQMAHTGAESQAVATFAGTMVLLGVLLLLAASNRMASGRRVNA